MSTEQSGGTADSEDRAFLLAHLLREVAARRQSGAELSDGAVCAAHPELMPELAEGLKCLRLVARARAQEDPGQTLKTDGTPAPPMPAPDSFAGYQIIREVHRGGQGVVYQAVQKSTKRKVALKVMREGPFASPAERARFDREVEILGQLNHPNIVAIHDSGQAAGCHYFVMDYISGQPLDLWMTGGDHSIEEVLRLFAKICSAVNAAHLRGITHRDLKPGNIRIDDHGEPRILDFGLAKVAHSADEASLMTVTGQFLGSLPWASPEQAEGVPSKIDIRTDVYSLGVVLYQMLTGRFPYEVIGNMRDVLDRIMKTEPARPSTIRKRINDEIETIVLKCLAKERERRYQSAGELARDIGHYLAGEPIEAKRDSVAYVLRKYIYKHRIPTAVGAGFVVVIAAGLAASLTYWRQAVVERGRAEERRVAAEASEAKAVHDADEAEKERDKAECVAGFMSETLAGVGPWVARGRDTTMLKEMMDTAAKRIDNGELKEVPEAELRLRVTIGDTYRELAAYDAAERMLRPALELARTLHAGDSPDVANSLTNLARLLKERGEPAAAEPLFRDALAMNRRLHSGDDADVANSISDLGLLLQVLGDLQEAELLLREALEMHRRLHPGDHPNVAIALNNLALLLGDRGDRRAAETLLREALEMHRRSFPGDEPDVASMLANLAGMILDRGDPAAAEPLFREAVEMNRRLFPGEHPHLANAIGNLAAALGDKGDLLAAEPLSREALEMKRRLYSGDHPDLVTAICNLATVLQQRGDLAAAEPLFREALEMNRRLFPGDHPHVANTMNSLACLLNDRGNASEAELLLRETLDMRRRLFPANHPLVGQSLNSLGVVLDRHGNSVAAEPLLQEALDIYRESWPPGHWYTGAVANSLGHCLTALDHFQEAETVLQEANSIFRIAPQGMPPDLLGKNLRGLVDLYESWHAAEPDQGHDQQAAKWRARLTKWQASTQPATSAPDDSASEEADPSAAPNAPTNGES